MHQSITNRQQVNPDQKDEHLQDQQKQNGEQQEEEEQLT